jgi:hypothetical protein
MNEKNHQLPEATNDFLKLQEMQGYHCLKMKKEALRLARFFLEKPLISAEEFYVALEVVDGFAGKSRCWLALLENGYSRLNRRAREKIRSRMLMVFSRRRNRTGEYKYLPKSINHKTNLFDLLACWEIWLEDGQIDKLKKSVPIMSRAIQAAKYVDMSVMLSAA